MRNPKGRRRRRLELKLGIVQRRPTAMATTAAMTPNADGKRRRRRLSRALHSAPTMSPPYDLEKWASERRPSSATGDRETSANRRRSLAGLMSVQERAGVFCRRSRGRCLRAADFGRRLL